MINKGWNTYTSHQTYSTKSEATIQFEKFNRRKTSEWGKTTWAAQFIKLMNRHGHITNCWASIKTQKSEARVNILETWRKVIWEAEKGKKT